jgi:hypothetical protein
MKWGNILFPLSVESILLSVIHKKHSYENKHVFTIAPRSYSAHPAVTLLSANGQEMARKDYFRPGY